MDRVSNGSDKSLEETLNSLKEALRSQRMIRSELSEFATHFPYSDKDTDFDQDSLRYFSDMLKAAGLRTYPQIAGGFLKLGIDTPLVIYSDAGNFNHESMGYRYALASVRVGVIMARIDGRVDQEELLHIEQFIDDMNYLNTPQRLNLIAYCNYLALASGNQEGSEQSRDFYRVSTSVENVVSKIVDMPLGIQQHVLEIARDIAVADGVLDPHEIAFLQELYRALEIPAKKARFDLKTYASEKHVNLSERGKPEPEIATEHLDELEETIGGILEEFELF